MGRASRGRCARVAHLLSSASPASSLHYEYACLARPTSAGYSTRLAGPIASTAATIAQMDASTSSTTPQRSFWRFSLRELMLFMLAVAAFVSATLFVSNDRGFRAVIGLPLVLLDDILAAP